MTFPTPHLEKLNAALENEKLPAYDKPRIEKALKTYYAFIKSLNQCYEEKNPEKCLSMLVQRLNEYKLFIELDLVFDSEEDFLYRQKGQLKLDNSIIEEFLPRLIHPSIIPELKSLNVSAGPTTTFSAVHFVSSLDNPQPGAGMHIRTKDQDFAITKKLYLKASHDQNFENSTLKETYIAYVVAEVKTNLDKTMFQEACATANDVKSSVSGARYFLLCEWLDMTPVSTAPTDIDEVIILRKAKRLSSNIRKDFDTFRRRQTRRAEYQKYLVTNPVATDMIERFVGHIRKLIVNDAPIEKNVLSQGYF